MISQYRERLARRCREVGLTEEQCELWLARCVDRVSYEELARARARGAALEAGAGARAAKPGNGRCLCSYTLDTVIAWSNCVRRLA